MATTVHHDSPPPAPGVVGSRMRMRDGDAYVRGQVAYTGDVKLPGTVHMALLRSPHAHARLVSIDCRETRSLPGVLHVVTGPELAEEIGPLPPHHDAEAFGGHAADVRCLAVEKVIYVGQPVVAVVGVTEADAVAALRSIVIDYEPLPAVVDSQAALAPDAPLIYPEWGDNVLLAGVVGAGNFDSGASVAAHRLRGEFSVPRSTAAPIETRTYLAHWDARVGRLTWWGTTQAPHQMRWVLAKVLGHPEQQIRVIATRIGGTFGLKVHTHPEEILVAVLSRAIRRPVRWVESRAECMLQGGREQHHDFEAAFDHDGRIRAVRIKTVVDHGAASAGVGWAMAFVGAATLPNGYAIEGCEVDFTIAVTNKLPWCGVRGFGKEQGSLVMERIVDLVAARTGVDPAEVRRRNFVQPDQFPYRTSAGYDLDSGDYPALLELAADRFGYAAARERQAERRREGACVGIGIGFEVCPEGGASPGALIGGPQDTSTVRMNPSGEVTVLTGVTSPGNGNETGIAQIVAERLGVAIESVGVVQGDTDRCPYGYGNMSSRGLLTGGSAAALAADEVATKLRTVAARMLGGEPDQVRLAEGQARLEHDLLRALPIEDVAYAVYTLPLVLALGLEPTLESTRTWAAPNLRHTPDEGGALQTFSQFSNAIHFCSVEVDPETGTVRLERHVVAHDCGTVINPLMVDGQVHGSTVCGLGMALGEETGYGPTGQPLVNAFKTYLMPRAPDLPSLEVLHQVTPSPYTLLGTKGAGETGVGGAMSAVVNAVNDALQPLGASLHQLPVNPPRVLAAIHDVVPSFTAP